MSMIAKIKDTSFGLANDFKAFIAKGNVMDLAVGVIIGGAFASIVSSMVKDSNTPCIGMIGGKPDLSNITSGAHKAIVDGKEV